MPLSFEQHASRKWVKAQWKNILPPLLLQNLCLPWEYVDFHVLAQKKNHLPPNMKHFNAVKLFCFGFVPRKYFWGLYIEFSRAFPFRSNRIDAEMIAGLLCSANICCAVCWRQRGGNHSWTISVGEPWCCSSHFRCTAIYSVSELALERLQLLGSHLGSQQTGILPTVGTKGTAEPTSLSNKCIHQAQSCKAMIKYCTFCLYSGNNITPHSAFPFF